MALVLLLLAGLALTYQGLALVTLERHFAGPPLSSGGKEGVTLLKPLHGDEPRLIENLASFIAQDYAGPVQLLLATNSPDDAAAHAVRALITEHPEADIDYYPGPRAPGANGKMGSCAAALPLARHPVIVLSDSDMVVPPDYLSRITAALAQDGVGAVSCLYAGRGDAGFWSKLGAAMISTQSLPNIIVGMKTGMARPCMGSTIALRRDTLDAIGGFAAFADILADDHAIGTAVGALGCKVVIPPLVLLHAGAERSAGQLWRQHLRWAATIRDLAGAGHYGSILTHALPLSLIALLGSPLAGGVMVVMALALRLGMGWRVGRLARVSLFLIPLADLFAFGVFCGSLFARNIDWRGASLTMLPKGRIALAHERHE